jgi:thioredoxin:protein disulfide reductase
MRPFLAIFALTLLAAPRAWALAGRPGAESAPQPPVLDIRVTAAPSPLPSPGQGVIRVTVKVPKGYHIFGGSRLTASVEEASAGPGGVSFGEAKRSKGVMEEDKELGETFEIHRDAVTLEIPVRLTGGSPGVLKGILALDWQACQDFGDKVCFMPTTDKTPFQVELKASGETGSTLPAPGPSPAPAGSLPAVSAATAARPEGFGEAGRFVGFKSADAFLKWTGEVRGGTAPSGGLEALFGKVAKENVALALLLAFLFGLLSSLTPCIYPIIPITVAYIGSRSEGQGRMRGFSLSLVFVLGLALVYSILGAVSAKAGAAFGSLTQTPYVGIPIALLFYALSLSMFNLFEFKTPGSLTTRIEMTKQKGKGKGYLGALFIGALSGLVASPCIGPLILAILVVVAATGSAALGFAYLFAFALGMGVLFVVIGTFSGILASLPKSGSWMDAVRVLFGVLILAASFYFASLYLSRKLFFALGAVALWGVILFLLFGARRHFFTVPLRVTGIALSALAFAAIVLLTGTGGRGEGKNWRTDFAGAAQEAREKGAPMLLDFRADWCVACVELEKKTWPDAKVQKFLGGVVPVRLDMTKQGPAEKAILDAYGVKGLPTVILLKPEGGGAGKS